MGFIKIYNKEGKVLFNKNKLFCFIYKYETERETMYSINLSENPSKFHSLFECIVTCEEEKIRVSLAQDCVDYEIDCSQYNEKGRIPLNNKKRLWSKKSIKSKDNSFIEVESFDGNKSVVYKLKEEIFQKLINIKNGK